MEFRFLFSECTHIVRRQQYHREFNISVILTFFDICAALIRFFV